MLKSYNSEYERQRIKIISDLIPIGSYKSLDIGCGQGIFSKIMNNKGHNVLGVDINVENIKKATKEYGNHSNLRFITYDVKNVLELNKDNGYDLILCLEIIEHLDDWKKLLRDLTYLLKKDGKLIISTPNILSLEGLVGSLWAMRDGRRYVAWDDSHRKIFNSFEFVKSLKNVNLSIKKTIGYYFDSGNLPFFRFKMHIPFSSSSSFLFNMFGFETIIFAEKL